MRRSTNGVVVGIAISIAILIVLGTATWLGAIRPDVSFGVLCFLFAVALLFAIQKIVRSGGVFAGGQSAVANGQEMDSEKIFSEFIMHSLPGIFYVYDRAGRFFRWNRNFEYVSGYSAQEIALMHPLDFVGDPEKSLLKERIEEVFQSGYADVTAHFFTKDGRRIPYYFNGRKVTSGGTDYVIGMGLDISHQVRTEQVLIERTKEIERLSAHLQNIREEERAQIALEIHDAIGQQLTALKMDSKWLLKRSVDQAAADRINGMTALIDDTIKTVRRISTELRPGILDDLGLIAALEWQGIEFEKNTGIRVNFEANVRELPLERPLSINIFRVYQEALTNIARHAHASAVWTLLRYDNGVIQMSVRDNGRGIKGIQLNKSNSLGLISMKERVRIFNGEVKLDDVEPNGTQVSIKIPIALNVTTH